jgi:histidine triad (HIT) family protein
VFCSIVAGKTPAHKVFEDDTLLAFLDTRPLFPGHTLVVPRVHRDALADLAREELEPLLRAAQVLSAAMERALSSEGTFVALNDRVSQSVPHVHLHVVPRKRGDGLKGFFWPRSKYASDEEAAAVATKIREALVRGAAQPGGSTATGA